MNQKLEYETFVIGCLLGQTDISEIRIIIKPYHFADLDLRRSYERILELDDQNLSLDYGQLIDMNIDLAPVMAIRNGVASMKDLKLYAMKVVELYLSIQSARLLNRSLELLPVDGPKAVLTGLISSIDDFLGDYHEEEPSFAQDHGVWEKMIRESPGEQVIYSGLESLDAHLKPVQGARVVLIAARPSLGKTSLAVQMALRSAEKGKQIAFFSLETDVSQLMPIFVANELQINRSRLAEHDVGELDDRRNSEAYKKLLSYDMKLYSHSDRLSDIMAKIIHLKKTQGLDIAFIDYVGLISGDEKKNDTQANVIGRISRQLKALSLKLKIPIVVLAQLNRDCVKTSRKPEMADLRDSGSLEQDADFILMLHRPKTEQEVYFKHKTELLIVKNRTGSIGSGGFTDFNGRFQRFEECEAPLATNLSTYSNRSKGY